MKNLAAQARRRSARARRERVQRRETHQPQQACAIVAGQYTGCQCNCIVLLRVLRVSNPWWALGDQISEIRYQRSEIGNQRSDNGQDSNGWPAACGEKASPHLAALYLLCACGSRIADNGLPLAEVPADAFAPARPTRCSARCVLQFLLRFFLRAPLAQLDRASGYEPEGRVFESPRAHHFSPINTRLFRVSDFLNLGVVSRRFTSVLPSRTPFSQFHGVNDRPVEIPSGAAIPRLSTSSGG